MSGTAIQQDRAGTDRFFRALCNLSPFSTVLSSHIRKLLHAVASRPPSADGDHENFSLGLQFYTCLKSESGGWAGNLTDFILQGLCRDEHPFLSAVACGEEAAGELRLLYQADLRCLQQITRADIGILNRTVSAWEMGKADDRNPQRGSFEGARDELLSMVRKCLDWGTLVDPICEFVRKYGIGVCQGSLALSLSEDDRGRLALRPIEHFDTFEMNWWQGNESRVETIEENTQHLVSGLPAHNVLVWGPRGCGKSSLIRGLITKYFDRGLRGIQIRADQQGRLADLYSLVRNRPERFIGVLDNISLDTRSSSFRQLATALDGGLERPPSNLVFYATSNFKDLIDREGERPDAPPRLQVDGLSTDGPGPSPDSYDPQQQQRLDERRAIDDRFALKVFLDFPTKTQYDRLVLAYAERAGLTCDRVDLLADFNTWRMRHNHDLVGGRTIRDFVQWYASRECAS